VWLPAPALEVDGLLCAVLDGICRCCCGTVVGKLCCWIWWKLCLAGMAGGAALPLLLLADMAVLAPHCGMYWLVTDAPPAVCAIDVDGTEMAIRLGDALDG
jgi:hypothetical protein